MSVRAYKIIEIATEDAPTFNLWRDDELMKYLEDEGYDQRNGDGCGIWEFSKTDLEHILSTAKEDKASEETIKIIEQMIEEVGSEGNVQYYCF